MEERRNSTRHRVLRRGNIVYCRGHSAVACVVLNLSTGGAKLKIDEWLGLPDRFELRIENGPRREAEVCFRDMEMTGVRFTDSVAA